jgi:uncharacterized protein (DUF983 family)
VGEKSYKARRPSSKKAAAVDDLCPNCGEGRLVKIDENFISCDNCNFDIPIKEATDGEVQGEEDLDHLG